MEGRVNMGSQNYSNYIQNCCRLDNLKEVPFNLPLSFISSSCDYINKDCHPSLVPVGTDVRERRRMLGHFHRYSLQNNLSEINMSASLPDFIPCIIFCRPHLPFQNFSYLLAVLYKEKIKIIEKKYKLIYCHS